MPENESEVTAADTLPYPLSSFGKTLGEDTGIGELMEDLGAALADPDHEMAMLGGGQPSFIPEMAEVYRESLKAICNNPQMFQTVLGEYDPAEGNKAFQIAYSDMMNSLYGWGISPNNVGISSGGQSACFHLINALAGENEKVLIPLIPDYMGYRDQIVSGAEFMGIYAKIKRKGSTFKYQLDIDAVKAAPDSVRMMVVSRPTNPSGNVLSDTEISALSDECQRRNIPLIIDHAYGSPAPGAVYVETKSEWKPHHIHIYSLSKLGLPGTRTAIVVARPAIIRLLANMTAVSSLANPNVGQAVILPLLKDQKIAQLAQSKIKPFYREKRDHAVAFLRNQIADKIDYSLHAPEGAFFLWLWLPKLKVTSKELVNKLRHKGVLAISGHWFFFGNELKTNHSQQCIRLTYSMDKSVVEKGIQILSKVLIELSD